MRDPAPASNTPARPIISDDAFHGGEDIPPENARFTDTGFGRKRVIPNNESAGVIVAPHVRSQPAGAMPDPGTSPLAPAGAFSDRLAFSKRNGPAQ